MTERSCLHVRSPKSIMKEIDVKLFLLLFLSDLAVDDAFTCPDLSYLSLSAFPCPSSSSQPIFHLAFPFPPSSFNHSALFNHNALKAEVSLHPTLLPYYTFVSFPSPSSTDHYTTSIRLSRYYNLF